MVRVVEIVGGGHLFVLECLSVALVGLAVLGRVHLLGLGLLDIHGVVGYGRHLHAGRVRQHAQVLDQLALDLVQVLVRVLIGHVGRTDVELEVGPVVLEVVVVGQLVGDVGAERQRGLVGPGARHIADGVAAAAEQQQRQVVALHELDAASVALEREVEAAEAVARQRVGAALQHDGVGLIELHHLGHDRLKDGVVDVVVDAVAERKVDGVVLALAGADVAQVAGAREVLAVLVERDGHDAIGGVEGLLDAVAVVHVDVDVEHALVVLEQLENGEHDVVDVAEAGRLALLGVMQTAAPVDGDVRRLLVELDGAGDRAARAYRAKLVEAVEDGTVLAHVEARHELVVLVDVVRSDVLEEADVLVAVELGHVLLGGLVRPIDLHLAVEAVVEHQVVRHAYAVRLHRVALAVVVVADVAVVVVADATLRRLAERRASR